MEDEHISKRARIDDITLDPEDGAVCKDLFAEVIRGPNPLESSTRYLIARPGDPIVWKLRLLVLEKLDVQWEKELDLVAYLAEDGSENYLTWNYRRCIVKKIGTIATRKELEFTAKIISKDAKNYHAWSHRQWILKQLDGNLQFLRLEDELKYCHEILTKDIFNTFAWNQRWFVVTCTKNGLAVRKYWETWYALRAIEHEPGNKCPWTYLRLLHSNDMEYLRRFCKTYVCVLKGEVEFLRDGGALNITVAPHLNNVDVLMNRWGCLNAVNLILDLELLEHGYESEDDLTEAFNFLGLDSREILESLDPKVKWRAFFNDALDAEKIIDFLGPMCE